MLGSDIKCEAYIKQCIWGAQRKTWRVVGLSLGTSYILVISFASLVFLTAPELLYKMVVIGKKPDPLLSISCQLIKPKPVFA